MRPRHYREVAEEVSKKFDLEAFEGEDVTERTYRRHLLTLTKMTVDELKAYLDEVCERPHDFYPCLIEDLEEEIARRK